MLPAGGANERDLFLYSVVADVGLGSLYNRPVIRRTLDGCVAGAVPIELGRHIGTAQCSSRIGCRHQQWSRVCVTLNFLRPRRLLCTEADNTLPQRDYTNRSTERSNASCEERSPAMKQVDESKQFDLWTWIVVGLIFSAVMMALYGPFVWEHWVVATPGPTSALEEGPT